MNLVFFSVWNAIKVYRQCVSCGRNSSYSFPPIVLKLCRCFLHGMKMCMWVWYNILIIVSHFFCFVNLVSFFLHEMLSKCIDSGYFVGATPLTVCHWLFWNSADVVFAWNEDMHVVWVQYLDNFFSLFSSPEPKAHRWAYSIGRHPLSIRHPSVIRQHF